MTYAEGVLSSLDTTVITLYPPFLACFLFIAGTEPEALGHITQMLYNWATAPKPFNLPSEITVVTTQESFSSGIFIIYKNKSNPFLLLRNLLMNNALEKTQKQNCLIIIIKVN